MIGLFKLSIFLDSILTCCMFLEICPFLLGYPINWHLTHGSILWFFLLLLYLYGISMYLYGISMYLYGIFSFSSYFIWILFLFFLVTLDKCLSILSFQKTNSWFHWSLMLSSVSIYYSFLLVFFLFRLLNSSFLIESFLYFLVLCKFSTVFIYSLP